MDLAGRRQALQREQKEKSASIERLETEIGQIDSDLAHIPKKTKTLITRKNLEANRGAAQTKIQKLRQQISEIDAALSDSRQTQVRLEERVSALQRKIEANESLASDVAMALCQPGRAAAICPEHIRSEGPP